MPKNVVASSQQLNQYLGAYRSRTQPTVTPGNLQTLTFTECSGSTSKALLRGTIPLSPGQAEDLHRLKIVDSGGTEVRFQFDQISRWDGYGGNCRVAVFHIADTDFTGSEVRNLYLQHELSTTPFDNTSTITTADVTSETNFSATLTNVANTGGPDPIGSTLTSSLNDAIANGVITQTARGPVCDSWLVTHWFYNGATPHPHLYARWHVTRWKNADESLIDYEIGCVIAQDEIDNVAAKELQTYDAELFDGVTSMGTWLSVSHPWGSHWMMFDQTNSDGRYGRRFMRTTTRDYDYQIDVTALIASGLVPDYDLSPIPIHPDTGPSKQVYGTTISPCDSGSHRAAINATGEYMGRGIICNCDVYAIIDKTPADNRISRVQGFAGLHVPFHHRCDTYHRIYANVHDPYPASFSTIAGLKPPEKRKSNGGTGIKAMPSRVGGTGVWTIGNDSSHAVTYSYFAYLITGERYFLDAQHDLCNVLHLKNPLTDPYIYGYTDVNRQAATSIPNTRYFGVPLVYFNQVRNTAWSLNLLAGTYAIGPDDDPEAQYIRKLTEFALDYINTCVEYLPPDQKAAGVTYHYEEGYSSPWQWDLIEDSIAHMYGCTRRTDAKQFMDYCAIRQANIWSSSQAFPSSYRGAYLNGNKWDGTTTTYSATGGLLHTNKDSVFCVSSFFTAPVFDGGLELQNGDTVVIQDRRNAGSVITLPPEITPGLYYVVNYSGGQFQISATEGGAPITLTDGEVSMSYRMASANSPGCDGLMGVGAYGNAYRFMNEAAAKNINRWNNAIVTDAMIDTINAVHSNATYYGHLTWRRN